MPPEATLDQIEQALSRLERRAGDLQERRRLLRQRIESLKTAGEQVADYAGSGMPLDGSDRFAFLHFVAGSLPEGRLPAVQEAIRDPVALLPLAPHHGRQPLIAVTTPACRAAVERILQQAGFQPASLPVAAGATTATLAAGSLEGAKEAARELEQLDDAWHSCARDATPRLAAMRWRVDVERRLLDAEQHFPRNETAMLMRGWVPAAAEPAPREGVARAVGGLLDKFGAVGALFYWGFLGVILWRDRLAALGLLGVTATALLLLCMAGWSAREPLACLQRRHAGLEAGPDGLLPVIIESCVGEGEEIRRGSKGTRA